jgi:hypothetical protein
MVALAQRTGKGTTDSRLRAFARDNGLSITVLALFLAFLAGQTISGWHEHNEELSEHGQPVLSLGGYLSSGHFVEATAENWESEFLQMAFYVWLTAFLFQKGSSESKRIGAPEAVDRDPRLFRTKRNAPWPVHRGGWVLWLYERSLTLAFLLLFLVSFAIHAAGGAALFNEEQQSHGEEPVSVLGFMTTSRFWFESFQNWQSEFLALAAMAVLSIYLRQRGSPESKPVDAPHDQTGAE